MITFNTMISASIGYGIGTYLLSMYFTRTHKKNLLTNTPASTIRSIAMGFVHLQGRPSTDTPVIAPLSKQECMYYQIRILVATSNKSQWKTHHTEHSTEHLYIEDDTGRVEVDVKKADLKVHSTDYAGEALFTPEAKNILEANNITIRRIGNFYTPSVRIQETTLTKQQEITIYGTADDNPRVEDGSQQIGHKDILITKRKGRPLIISETATDNPAEYVKGNIIMLTMSFYVFIITTIALILANNWT